MILLFYILHIDTYIILKLSLYPYGASILRGPKKDTDYRRIIIHDHAPERLGRLRRPEEE